MTKTGDAVIPKKAMTIILLRDQYPAGFEVFLLKRHNQSIFMGGNYVYPGGKVDEEDAAEEILARSQGISSRQAQEILGENDAKIAIAYWIAGIRELFEEAGILLAYNKEKRLLSIDSEDAKQRLAFHMVRLPQYSRL